MAKKKRRRIVESRTVENQKLAARLNRAINDMTSEDKSRSSIIADMARAAGITPGTVNQILNGEIDRPPAQRLRGFARVLKISADELTRLAGGNMDESVRLWYEAAITPVGEAESFTGSEWEVTIIGASSPDDLIQVEGQEFVRSKNDRLYSVSALEASTPQWEGIKVFDNHLTEEEFRDRQGMRSAQSEWLGTITGPFWDAAGRKVKGIFKVVETALASKLKAAWEQGVLGTIGLSIDTFPVIKREATIEHKRFPIIEGFNKILSVDLVAEPAAGGSFDRIMASTQLIDEVADMDKQELQELIAKTISDTLAQAVPEQVRQTLAEALGDETADTEEQVTEEATTEAEETEAEEAETEQPEVPEVASEAVRLLESRVILSEAIQAANLNAKGANLVKQAYGGRIFKESELNAFIKSVKETQAASDPSGRVTENGRDNGKSQTISGGFDEKQRIEVEFMRLVMGNHDFQSVEHNQENFVQQRLKESNAYSDWLKQGKPNTGGYRRLSALITDMLGGDPFMDDFRLSEASTLATVTKNAMNVMIAADYSLQQRWYETIVNVEEVDTIDDATLARLYGVATLDVVNAGAAYTELAQDDEEETATFVKRGNFVGVPMEDLMKDKLNYFRSIPRRLSDTWYNTLSELTANVFTVNSDAGPVLSDTGALFNATAATTAGGHANLLTTALSHSEYSTVRTAMRKQTNRPLGVGRRIQASPAYLLVPEDLEVTGLTIRNSELVPEADGAGTTGNQTANQFRNQFEVVVVPDWTDTNNWATVADPARFPAIWHIFPRGGNVPQLFTADSETVGAMFTNDTLRFKVRMLTYRFSATYDCAPVADFRPLHKSNV